jgi:hypothetical protein
MIGVKSTKNRMHGRHTPAELQGYHTNQACYKSALTSREYPRSQPAHGLVSIGSLWYNFEGKEMAKAKYLMDEKGRKTAVLLDIREYQRFLQRLEELEDALSLDEAIRTAQSFRDYGEIRAELKREGRL